MVMYEIKRDFYQVSFPSCVAEDSRSREGLQVCLDHLWLPTLSVWHQFACAKFGACGQKLVLDQFIVWGVLQHDQTNEAFFGTAVTVCQ